MNFYFIEAAAASASDYAKGERVAFKVGPNEWYLGVVTRVFSGNVSILFDDEDKVTVAPSPKLKKVTFNRKRKSALTDEQVKAIIVTKPKATATETKETSTKTSAKGISKGSVFRIRSRNFRG